MTGNRRPLVPGNLVPGRRGTRCPATGGPVPSRCQASAKQLQAGAGHEQPLEANQVRGTRRNRTKSRGGQKRGVGGIRGKPSAAPGHPMPGNLVHQGHEQPGRGTRRGPVNPAAPCPGIRQARGRAGDGAGQARGPGRRGGRSPGNPMTVTRRPRTPGARATRRPVPAQ